MPLGDVSAQQGFVSAYFGADSASVPASFDAALYTGDPTNGGLEVDFPGYARVTLTNNTTTFVNNGDGSATAAATFPDATGAAGTGSSVITDDAICWALFSGTTLVAWDFLASPLAVDAAGAVEPVEVTPYIPNSTSVA